MEIFQTIWTALTTENEFLVKITSFPMLILEIALSMLIFTTILNISATKKQKIIYLVLLSIIGFFTLWIIPAPYNSFVNLIACPILVYFIFKTTILKSILAEVIPYLIFIVVGSISLNICVNMFNISVDSFTNVPITKLCSSLFIYVVVYLSFKLISSFYINITSLDYLKKKDVIILLINMVLGITAIAFQSYIVHMYSRYIPLHIIIINIIVLLVYFSLSMHSLFRTSKLEMTTKQLQEEQLYNKTLNVLYDNIRGFKHDFQNIMQSLGGYIGANNMEGLKNYYKDLLPDSLKINQLDILNPDTINNPAVYSILTEKYHEADSYGITMNIEAFLNMQNINMKTYELTRVLGILLDNAIDAAKKCETKQINVIIRKDNKVNRQLFIIENTYTNKDVDTDKIFEKGYSSKPKEDKASHGLGLWEVRKILKRNNNLNLFTTKTDEYFKQQLEIYC